MTENNLTELQAQIQRVAMARAHFARAVDVKQTSYEKWKQENDFLIVQAANAEMAKDIEKTKLRELTLTAFKATGDKHPAPEVGIREGSELKYEKTEALTWAVEHKMALSLDTKAFEKIVKASPATFAFVEVVPTVTATITSDIPVK
jgi:hypothetical protein